MNLPLTRLCLYFLFALLVERQKLVRRIKKLKKAREEDEDEEVDKELLEARVLLNYVLVSDKNFCNSSVYQIALPNF